MAYRELNELRPGAFDLALAFLRACEIAGCEVLIYCTYRSCEEQARLYRQGRPLARILAKAEELRVTWGRPDLAQLLIDVGPQFEPRVVTHAGPGQSNHNWRGAFDFVPLRAGKPVWGARSGHDRRLWYTAGEIGEAVGLEWAGRWARFREFPHLQDPACDWRQLIKGDAHAG